MNYTHPVVAPPSPDAFLDLLLLSDSCTHSRTRLIRRALITRRRSRDTWHGTPDVDSARCALIASLRKNKRVYSTLATHHKRDEQIQHGGGNRKIARSTSGATRRGDVTPVASNHTPVHFSRFKWQIVYALFVTYILYIIYM